MTDPTTLLPGAPIEPVERPANVTLTLTGVTRAFGGRRVLGPLDLSLDGGALAVIYGVNGAGKTTLLRVAAGLLTPSGGTRVCPGRAVYLRPGGGARRAMTVEQALRHTAALCGTRADSAAKTCRLVGLTGALSDRPVGELSAGQHARLAVALALVARPVLACLDEPTAHLDADGVEHVRAALRLLIARGTSVLLASHSPQEFGTLTDARLHLHAGLLWEPSC